MRAWWRDGAGRTDHGSAVDVVLTDEGPGPTPPRPGPTPPPAAGAEVDSEPDGRAARRRATAPRLAVAAVLVAAVLVVAHVTEQQRAQERLALHAGMPGTVSTLQDAPVALWSHGLPPAGAARAGHLVLLDERGEQPRIRALRAADGRELWSLERPPSTTDRCWTERDEPEVELVVCWRSPMRAVAETRRGRGEVTSMVLQAADGSVLAERTVPLPTHAPAVVGSDLVVADQRGGTLTVRRAGLLDDAPRWQVDVPDEGAAVLPGAGAVRVEHGLVLVQGPVTVVLDLEDGSVLGTWYPEGPTGLPGLQALDGAAVRALPDGFAVWAGRSEGRPAPGGTWFDREGRPVAPLPGVLQEPATRDGSASEVLLTVRADLHELAATDTTTDDVLWRASLPGAQPVVRRDGAVVLVRDGVAHAVDLRSGEDRWSAAVDGLQPTSGWLTDGTVLVVVADRGGRHVLVGVELDAGRVLWETAVDGLATETASSAQGPAARAWVGEVAGRAVLVDGISITGLG